MKYNKQKQRTGWGIRTHLVHRSIFTRNDGIAIVHEAHTKGKNVKRYLLDNWKYEYMNLPFDDYQVDWDGEEE